MVVSLTFILMFNLVSLFYINDSIVISHYSTCWSHMICYNPCMDLSTIASFKIIIFIDQKLNSLRPFLVLLNPPIYILCSKDLTSFIGSPTHVYTPTDQIF
jgi:hypothetical protein